MLTEKKKRKEITNNSAGFKPLTCKTVVQCPSYLSTISASGDACKNWAHIARSSTILPGVSVGCHVWEILAVITLVSHTLILQMTPIMLIVEAVWPKLPYLPHDKLSRNHDLSDASQNNQVWNAPQELHLSLRGNSFPTKIVWLSLSQGSQSPLEKKETWLFFSERNGVPQC